jgi:uroporphyrinogen-III synthase
MMANFLITRTVFQSKELVNFLEAQGNWVFVEPIFNVKKNVILENFEDVSACILTSFNAIDGFLSAKIAKNVTIFVLSEKIAQEIAKNGYENVKFSPKNRVNELEKMVFAANLSKNGKILYFCGNYITKNITNNFIKNGFLAQDILSYEVSYSENFSDQFLQEIKVKKFDFVLCFSKNAAKNLMKLIKKNNLLENFKESVIMGMSDEIVQEIKNQGFNNFANFKQNLNLKNFYKL